MDTSCAALITDGWNGSTTVELLVVDMGRIPRRPVERVQLAPAACATRLVAPATLRRRPCIRVRARRTARPYAAARHTVASRLGKVRSVTASQLSAQTQDLFVVDHEGRLLSSKPAPQRHEPDEHPTQPDPPAEPRREWLTTHRPTGSPPHGTLAHPAPEHRLSQSAISSRRRVRRRPGGRRCWPGHFRRTGRPWQPRPGQRRCAGPDERGQLHGSGHLGPDPYRHGPGRGGLHQPVVGTLAQVQESLFGGRARPRSANRGSPVRLWEVDTFLGDQVPAAPWRGSLATQRVYTTESRDPS